MFPAEYAPRFTVRPGLTGLWQVSGRSTLGTLDMLRLDVRYVRTRTLWTDLGIILSGPCRCCCAGTVPGDHRPGRHDRRPPHADRRPGRAHPARPGPGVGDPRQRAEHVAAGRPRRGVHPVRRASATCPACCAACCGPTRCTGGGDPRRAVSTGSGIALGYLPYLAARGVECHYIESAARVGGPSLTGRILRWVPRRAHLHPVPALERPALALRRQRFRRLRAGPRRPPARRADPGRRHRRHRGGVPVPAAHGRAGRACSRPAASWSRPPGGRCRCCGRPVARPSTTCRSTHARSCPPPSSTAALAEADIVVSHAGTGSALANLAAGRFAVMVSRRRGVRRGRRRPPGRSWPTSWSRAGWPCTGPPRRSPSSDLLATRGTRGAAGRRGAAVRPAPSAFESASTPSERRPAPCRGRRRPGHRPPVARAGRRPAASLFTSPPWIAAVCGTYGFTPQARIAVDRVRGPDRRAGLGGRRRRPRAEACRACRSATGPIRPVRDLGHLGGRLGAGDDRRTAVHAALP